MSVQRLVFVRHGETDWNVSGVLQGRTDIPLNPRGRDQAETAGRALLAAMPDARDWPCLTSPLQRAQNTARLMRRAMGLDPDAVTLEPRLQEMSFGRWEGSSFREIKAREPGTMKLRDKTRWTHRPPGGESYEDVSARVAELLAGLTAPTILVSHGGVCRALLSLLTDLPREALVDMRVPQGRALALEEGGWRWV